MGKQEATDDVGMPFEIESNIMESYVSDDEHGEIVFPRINADVSIEDKINLIVERHNNDYYRGIPVDQLEHVNQQIRPRKLVTSEYLHKIRSEICRNAKLSWIMSKKEEIYALMNKESCAACGQQKHVAKRGCPAVDILCNLCKNYGHYFIMCPLNTKFARNQTICFDRLH